MYKNNKKILTETAEEFDKIDKLNCEVEFYDIIKQERVCVKTFSDVANYFIRIIEYYLVELWKNDDVISRLGTSEEFHCYILNYNVRTFLSFLSDTLGNGGFKPLTKEFNNSTNTGYYTIYNYIEMIIRGQWLVHPGNDLMDGGGGNGAPIVFNIFDSSLWDITDNVKHFMLNIRILQYFALCTNPSVSYITYGKLKSVLGKFFDEEYISMAVKQLIYVRILYSYFEGDDNVASKKDMREVIVTDATKLSLSSTGKFYLEKFIYEFEYLYQMAISSLMPTDYVRKMSNNKWKYEKELTVLYFLEGIFKILKINIEMYRKNCCLDSFIDAFCQNDVHYCKPYRRMLQNFISVMNNKVQRAENMEIKNLENLCRILDKAKELEKQTIEYFSLKLGEGICF